ncbi:MAG TPA: helix-turn-helix transcriptional regulator [Candidatus Limnocylindrales bacterium]|nr:helix-turn-helix transcriptional regulator [Candidatus Limnocylindrales bacterium]
MAPTFEQRVRRVDEVLARQIGGEIADLRADAGITRHGLATVAGVDAAFLGRIERGAARPSQETLVRIALALGADLRTHMYPNTGPALRDRFAAPMLELLLRERHPRWDAYPEMLVHRPSRGAIDLGLHDPRQRVFVASELQSELRRLEQLVRWHTAKVESLVSWEGWDRLGEEPRVGRLLVVRRTRANRAIAAQFAAQLHQVFPAHPDDLLRPSRVQPRGLGRRSCGYAWKGPARRLRQDADHEATVGPRDRWYPSLSVAAAAEH